VAEPIKAILLDIEGTTTPINFVHETLFPFSRDKMGDFVSDNFENLSTEIELLKRDHTSDRTYDRELDELSPSSVSAYLLFLIDSDRKSTPLKSIQGQIWQQGYTSGRLQSEVFDDVPRAFERWGSQGTTIAIYSSGSVLAQQLLFKYTNHCDLTPYISNYFDTNVGDKKDPVSFARIADALGFEPATILFISDSTAELIAARETGYQIMLSVRDGNRSSEDDHLYPAIRSFDELDV
jgi:enolase-phosphatase E1